MIVPLSITLWIVTSIAIPFIPPSPILDRGDTSPPLGPFNALISPSLLHAESPSGINGTGFRSLGAAADCPGGSFTCSAISCCYDGEICCSDGACCHQGNYCYGTGCIPNGGTPCGIGHYCKAGYRCYQDQSCIPENGFPCGPFNFCYNGETCCSDFGCCISGLTCGGDGYCYFGSRVVSSEAATSASEKFTSVSSVQPTSPTTTPAITTPKFSTPKFPTSTSSSTTSALPTIYFGNVPGINDAVTQNICNGLSKRGKGNTEVLTYAKRTESEKNKIRNQAGCVTGKCNFTTTGLSCDEYPFASTQEGGPGAQISCVPAYQNTLQGTYLSVFYSYYHLSDGDKFAVQASCFHAAKRASVQGSGSNGTLLPPFGSSIDPSAGHVVLPLGDLQAGTYTIQTSSQQLVGIAGSVIIYDSDGAQFSQASIGSDGRNTENFTLFEDGTGLGVVISPQSKVTGPLSVNYSYTGTTTSIHGASGSGPTPNRPDWLACFWVLMIPVFILVWL